MLLTTFLLPLAVSAAVLGEQSAEAVNVVVEKLEPRYRKTANRARYKMGPYTLNGSKGGSGLGDSTMQGQAIFMSMPPKTLCNRDGPCTILAGKVGVVYADGKDANPSNGIYIHHILTSDSTKKQTPWLSQCGSPNTPALNIAGILGGTAFVGTGEDSADGLTVYTSEDGTRDSGYHVGAQDTFTGWAQIVNYNKESKSIYVFYDLEWVPGTSGFDVKTATFTATCGGSPAIKLGNGPTNTTSGKFYFMDTATYSVVEATCTMAASRWTCSSTISTCARLMQCTACVQTRTQWEVTATIRVVRVPLLQLRMPLSRPSHQ